MPDLEAPVLSSRNGQRRRGWGEWLSRSNLHRRVSSSYQNLVADKGGFFFALRELTKSLEESTIPIAISCIPSMPGPRKGKRIVHHCIRRHT